jgi:hypothetical protein
MSIWNKLIKLRDSTKDEKTKKDCNMYLSQINTASGKKAEQEAEAYLALISGVILLNQELVYLV